MPPFLRNSGKGWVTAEYGMLPRATSTRTQREASDRQGRRPHAGDPAADRPLAALGREADRARRADDLDRLRRHPGRRRHAHRVDHRRLRRAGAGARSKLRERRSSRTIPITDYVAATSVGIVDGTPLLDLAYDEDSKAEVDMNVVKTGDGRFIELQGTAEGAALRSPRARRAAGARRQRHQGPDRHAARGGRRFPEEVSAAADRDDQRREDPRDPGHPRTGSRSS